MKCINTTIRNEILKYWPYLTKRNDILIADRTYWMPSLSKLESLVYKTYIDGYKYVKEMYDCDDFALSLHAFVAQTRYEEAHQRDIPKEDWYTWSFGQAWGSRFRGVDTNHAINICMTSDAGLVLIEPQNDAIWEINNEKDKVTSVRM